MVILKWYCLVICAGALALAGLFYPDAYRWYGQFEPGTMEAAQIHWSMFMDWSNTVSYVSPYVLGLTFVIGLFELVRSHGRSALLLAPSVALFAVGVVLSMSELVTWYVGSSIGDTSVYLAVKYLFRMVGTELVATLVLGGLLFAGAIVKLRRAA